VILRNTLLQALMLCCKILYEISIQCSAWRVSVGSFLLIWSSAQVINGRWEVQVASLTRKRIDDYTFSAWWVSFSMYLYYRSVWSFFLWNHTCLTSLIFRLTWTSFHGFFFFKKKVFQNLYKKTIVHKFKWYFKRVFQI
jgi:hypothetical protein